ncbi:MAG: type II secretion system protein [Gallionella sp.]|nr:type II secretion system protein [Gallionella sp.]
MTASNCFPDRQPGTRQATPLRSTGFTLVEMSIVLAVMALLLGGLLPVISGQIEQQRRTETRKYMDEVREALLGYAIAHKHLPCPDSNDDGTAELTCSTASSAIGTLPYADLGVADKDAYGKVLDYAVTIEFANSAAYFTLLTAGGVRVCTAAATPTTNPCTANLTSKAAAIIVSPGANWATATSADETENTDGDPYFVSHDFVQNGFDDMVVWISPNILFNRMVTAGQLP